MLTLDEVNALHARYLIGFWRKSFYARSMRLVDNEDDPPIVNELKNLLFWTRDDESAGGKIHRIHHVDGLAGLIESAKNEVQRMISEIESDDYAGDSQKAIELARKQLEIANAAEQLLGVMING